MSITASGTPLYRTPDGTMLAELSTTYQFYENANSSYACLSAENPLMQCLDIATRDTFSNPSFNPSIPATMFGQTCNQYRMGDGLITSHDATLVMYIQFGIYSLPLDTQTVNTVVPNAEERCAQSRIGQEITPYACPLQLTSYSSDQTSQRIQIRTVCTRATGTWYEILVDAPVASADLMLNQNLGGAQKVDYVDGCTGAPEGPTFAMHSSKGTLYTTDHHGITPIRHDRSVLGLTQLPDSRDLSQLAPIRVKIFTPAPSLCLEAETEIGATLGGIRLKGRKCAQRDRYPRCSSQSLANIYHPDGVYDTRDFTLIRFLYFNRDARLACETGDTTSAFYNAEICNKICGCKNVAFDVNCDGTFDLNDLTLLQTAITAPSFESVIESPQMRRLSTTSPNAALVVRPMKAQTKVVTALCALSRTIDGRVEYNVGSVSSASFAVRGKVRRFTAANETVEVAYKTISPTFTSLSCVRSKGPPWRVATSSTWRPTTEP